MFEQATWDRLYDTRDTVWGHRPNPQLVAEAADLPPGDALDIGSGEGADAVWLARRRWRVTGVDFSPVALDRARVRADEADVADRIEWRQVDLRTWSPEGRTWDLVSSQYLHLPAGEITQFVARLGELVSTDGTLLVVGHHPRDAETGLRWNVPDVMFTVEELIPALAEEEWEVQVAEERARTILGPDGGRVPVLDTVLKARRR